jgi:hypothetical protein
MGLLAPPLLHSAATCPPLPPTQPAAAACIMQVQALLRCGREAQDEQAIHRQAGGNESRVKLLLASHETLHWCTAW